jgi:hypothetical protein
MSAPKSDERELDELSISLRILTFIRVDFKSDFRVLLGVWERHVLWFTLVVVECTTVLQASISPLLGRMGPGQRL